MLLRRLLCVALVAVGGVIAVPAPAMAAADFSIVDSAAFEGEPVPRNALLTIFTGTPVTPTAVSYVPCAVPGVHPVQNAPILYYGPSGGGTQINIYYPNFEWFSGFNLCAGLRLDLVTVHLAGGGFLQKGVQTIKQRPGIFMDGASPAGYHINVGNNVLTPLSVCATTPVLCKVTASGQPNYLVLFTTGGNPDPFCPACGYTPKLGTVTQTIDFFGYAGFTGQEQMNVRLNPATPAGTHQVALTVAPGYTANPTNPPVVRLSTE